MQKFTMLAFLGLAMILPACAEDGPGIASPPNPTQNEQASLRAADEGPPRAPLVHAPLVSHSPTPDLHAAPPPRPPVVVADPPSLAENVCTFANVAAMRCPPDYPHWFGCPSSAQPIGCIRSTGSFLPGHKGVCCP